MNLYEENSNLFRLPKNYFGKSALSIANKIEWIDEHKEFPILQKINKEIGFTAPEKYFEQLEANLELQEFENLKKFNKTLPFTLPSNYFTENKEQTLFNLNQTKLSSISKENPFALPSNYFEGITKKLNADLNNTDKTKVISLFAFKKQIKYAAAAALILSLCIVGYRYFAPASKDGECVSVACLETKELIKTKHLEIVDDEELYKLVNVKKLEDKLTKSDSVKPDSTNLKSNENELIDEL
ncbi:MAG: hypothetical protein JSU07_13420 [Bacteroidetes bacterium]|nr:hypothetical protein [Bacteroidota bacterium]